VPHRTANANAPMAHARLGAYARGLLGGGGGGESFLRVHWVAVPEALRARRVNRRPRWIWGA
jgi:hypothetical protein